MTGQRSSIVSALFTCFLLPAIVRATCYNPDGSEITNPAFQPCNQVVGKFSMCCGTNWTGGVVMPDTCQENGLCLNSFDNAPLYWRGSCTDPTWKSPNCLANLCASDGDAGVDGSAATQNVAVTECSDGSWCCGGGNKSCCNDGSGTRIAAVVGQEISSSHSSSSKSTASPSSTARTTLLESTTSPSSTAPTTLLESTTSPPESTTPPNSTSPPDSTSTPPSTSQPTSQPKESSGLSTGAIAGIAVACGLVGLAIIAGAVVYLILKTRRSNDALLGPARSGIIDEPAKGYYAPPIPVQELHATTWRAEIMTHKGHQDRAELADTDKGF
ncbi:hypothetical protein V502_03559 [Pseudogymnoascus sp. VKM F-4520 (FW-2644)]|nr:hypothetical protein V502_03559 [Pseudogymnoascus sp. VKM F-4520 (FW-2644)]